MSKEQSTGIPWWGKLVLYGGIVVGGIAVVSLAISSFFMGPVNAYKDMWAKQYEALLNKMANYTKTNPEGWTAPQQLNVNEEEKILDQTTQGLADAARGVYDLGTQIIIGLTTIGVSAVVAAKVVSYLKSRTGGQVRTGQGAGYIAIMGFADYLATNGYPTYATNLISTSQTMFQAHDLPYMQQTVNIIQSQLPNLVGVQLIVAQQMIEALNIEMATIPIWLHMPLPLPI